ncbi:MAG: mevalonate kinase [Salinivirgaceae bacterium]
MKAFSAKIILFGEYSILSGSKALAIPFPAFSGKLQAQHALCDNSLASAQIIKELFEYLKNQHFEANPNFEKLQHQIAQGLYFESTIPNGYGLGSSGALVAAVYHHFFKGLEDLSIYQHKADLAKLESYFHGTSSGIDPLVSFLNAPVLVQETTVETLQLKTSSTYQLILIDTGQKATTQGLVQYYKDLLSSAKQKEAAMQLNESTNRCIAGFLQNKLQFDDLKTLSELQQHLLKPMFVLNKVLLEAVNRFKDDASLKLCGSGGGGFVSAWVRKSKSPEFIDYLDHHKLTYHRV